MRYLTTTEAAALLHVDPSRVRLLCQRGRIRTIKIGNTYAIPDDELDRFASIPRPVGRPRRATAAGAAARTRILLSGRNRQGIAIANRSPNSAAGSSCSPP